ncbi:MAG TPA: zinc ribbon domain-containing protein, partial [Blastocatellia bacterium]|nr:zinc ribbon domain-containing protein [Blastocatellia bacterium]
MFCPKCSHQQATETVRFCSRCGFQLDVVKDLLASENAGEPTVSLKDAKRSLLRQVDILIGAGFMLVGSIKAALISTNIEVGGPDRLVYALYFLGLGFALFLLFAQISHRQRGLTFGATLMFAGALVAFAALEFLGLPGVLLVALFLFPLLIFWTRLA